VRARLSAPVQACCGAHPASCTAGTMLFPGVKRPWRGVDPPTQSRAEVKGGVKLTSSPTQGLNGLLEGEGFYLVVISLELGDTVLKTT
jgi:hypothetical protein